LKLPDFRYLADESLDRQVVAHLKQLAWDIVGVDEVGLIGKPDAEVLGTAYSQGRVVITHDSDFGMLAVAAGQPCVAIVYLRPGHIEAAFTIKSIDALIAQALDLDPPFIVVASRSADEVTIRVRKL
jgi:predicted nuclease of predicted toxin-antitoxin system